MLEARAVEAIKEFKATLLIYIRGMANQNGHIEQRPAVLRKYGRSGGL
jgi:hypothetical protein